MFENRKDNEIEKNEKEFEARQNAVGFFKISRKKPSRKNKRSKKCLYKKVMALLFFIFAGAFFLKSKFPHSLVSLFFAFLLCCEQKIEYFVLEINKIIKMKVKFK